MREQKPLIWIVVAGDLGRSPRMLRHALSFARRGLAVELIGLAGKDIPSSVAEHSDVRVRRIHVPEWPRRFGLIGAIARQIVLAIKFAAVLAILRRPVVAVVQNPPLLPVIAVPALRSILQRFDLWIDWHNTSHSMVGMRFGGGLLARMVRWMEMRVARVATEHLAVSYALARHLSSEGISATTLYDAPLQREMTPVAAQSNERDRRVVLPMSWSVDDDLELLLDVLLQFERRLRSGGLNLTLVITGDGPRRVEFMARLGKLRLMRSRIISVWVPADEYPKFLAGADAGLSVHRSSSGLDLPIKWIDILEAGLPLFTLDYGDVVNERLSQIPSSRRFPDAEGLADLLDELTSMTDEMLEQRKQEARADLASFPTWAEEWSRAAGKMLDGSRTEGR